MVSKKEALRIGKKLGMDFEMYDIKEFQMGVPVELEHRDIIGNSKLKAGMIAKVHLDEVPDYYTRLKKYVE